MLSREKGIREEENQSKNPQRTEPDSFERLLMNP